MSLPSPVSSCLVADMGAEDLGISIVKTGAAGQCVICLPLHQHCFDGFGISDNDDWASKRKYIAAIEYL